MRAAKKCVLRSSKVLDEELRKVVEYKRELNFEGISGGQRRRHWEVRDRGGLKKPGRTNSLGDKDGGSDGGRWKRAETLGTNFKQG